MKITNKRIAECIGLWLAEGDHKTSREITLTNSCVELVLYFHETIKELYNGKNEPRVYVYSPVKRVLISELNDLTVRNYVDSRARRTYYLYRLADVKFLVYWKGLVEKYKAKKEFYSDILRGFFAGEGNIKHDEKNNSSRICSFHSCIHEWFTLI